MSGQLLVAAGVEHGRRAGQLQEAIDHVVVLLCYAAQRLPHLGGFGINTRKATAGLCVRE